MKGNNYSSLCECIREHCHQQQWYGPDIYRNQSTFDRSPDEPWIRHDFRTRFFPLATEEQLRLSEEAMGFPYPPVLRTLYLQVANGGFGPAYGLDGAFGGYSDAKHKEEEHEYILQESIVYPSSSEEITLIDLDQYKQPGGNRKKIYIDPGTWPKHLIDLCEWGCGYFSLLHAPTGRVYYFGEDYLFHQADSLEEWLERWLNGENLEHIDWA